jgi:hypothetical protein
MTIDDQLREIARRTNQQPAITVEEVVHWASSQGTGSPTTRSRLNGHLDEEEPTMIDLETPSPTVNEHRVWARRVVLAGVVAAAAAAVIAIAVVTFIKDRPVSPADRPPPTVTVPARALFGTPGKELVAGRYFVDKVDGHPTPRIVVTVGKGWTNTLLNWAITKEGVGGMSFSVPDRVFTDACHASAGFYPGSLTTVDGLVAALSEQGGWAKVTAPSDITVDGYAGKSFQRTAPADFTGCTYGASAFRSWENDSPAGPGWSYYEPGEIETVRVLDVNGTVIIINTRLNKYHQDSAVAELAAMLHSIRIEQS